MDFSVDSIRPMETRERSDEGRVRGNLVLKQWNLEPVPIFILRGTATR